MGELVIPKCVECGGDLPPRGSRGPARRYCSDRCRVAAYRKRSAPTAWESAVGELAEVVPLDPMTRRQETVAAVAALLEGEAPGTPDEQLVRAILEARAVSFTFRRLGKSARREFAWRATEVADALDRALDKAFQGVGT